MTVHLVYPCDNPAQTPGAIGWHLARNLESRYGTVECHAWDGFQVIRPSAGDVLIGHLHPIPGTTMRRSIKERGWRRKILLNPFNFDVAQVGFLEPWLGQVDALVAICGPEWSSRLDFSYFSHWSPKFVPVDLAIDTTFFPFQATSPGTARRLLYVGHLRWYKNAKFLEALAEHLGDFELAWIGSGGGLRGWRALGYVPLSSPAGHEIAHEFGASVTVGSFDANPTTVLESMALGMLPFSTPTSGWSESQGTTHISTWSPELAAKRIREVYGRDSLWWAGKLAENRALAEQLFTWEHFSNTVVDVIENPPSGTVALPQDARRRVITLGALTSPLLRRQVVPQHLIRRVRFGRRLGMGRGPQESASAIPEDK